MEQKTAMTVRKFLSCFHVFSDLVDISLLAIIFSLIDPGMS